MNTILLLLFLPLICAWDYLLFVQYWPGSWIEHDHIKNSNFTNDHFNIHGIWPEYYNGSYPEFCNKSAIFDEKQLAPIRNNLTLYWTDYRNSEEFWKHEFYRHGTCAETDDLLSTELEFFTTGLELREKYNLYTYLSNSNIYPTNNNTYSLKNIYDAIQNQTINNIAITCKDDILDQIILCLNPNLNLIDCPSYLNTCQTVLIKYNFINK